MKKTRRKWTQTEIERLEKMWPTTTTAELAQKFKRTERAINKMAYLLKLGPKTSATEYMSLRALFNTILGYRSYGKMQTCIAKGIPAVQMQTHINRPVLMIRIDDFWEWAENHQNLLDFSSFELNMLGAEPSWVAIKRRQDFRKKLEKVAC